MPQMYRLSYFDPTSFEFVQQDQIAMLEKIRSAKPCKHILKEAMHTSMSASMTSRAHRPLHKPGFSESVERGQCGPLKLKKKKKVYGKKLHHTQLQGVFGT